MSELRKANTDHPYFITCTIVGWVDLFTRDRYCDIITESLRYCMINKGLKVFEYVIMPSHVHIICQQLDGKLADVIRDFKSFTAKEILKAINEPGESRREWLLEMFSQSAKRIQQNKDFMVWQKTNHPIELSLPSVYDQKVEYLIMNPITSGYVTDETAWKYSSAGAFTPLKLSEGGDEIVSGAV